jgi:hypothetical protein
MSLNWNFGTGAVSETASTLSYYPWEYDDAMRVKSTTPNQAKLTDILSPLDKTTELKISTESIANVYSTLASYKIPVAAQSANQTGTSVFVQLRTTVDYDMTVGSTTTNIQLPLEARLQIRVPNDAELVDAEITKLVGHLYSSICESDGTTRIGEIIRGGLVPKEI